MAYDIQRHRLHHRTRPLDVLVAGEGRPLALLHGWGLSGRAYRKAMLALADLGFRVIAPSIAVEDNWSIVRAAETAAEAMAGLDAAPAPVVGHSFGGAIGAQLALDHPDFVRGVVAVNSPLVQLGSMRLGKIMLPGGHYRIVGHGPAALALMRSATAPGGLGSLLRSARWFLGSGQDETLRTLKERGVPCRVVWAENDTLLPVTVGERAAELLGCELVRIAAGNGWPGTRAPDHDWPFREPEHFAKTIKRLVDEFES
ncbi:MAG: alpha/beta fold hydrolase [Actinomycetota bacterium]